jgi:hypothetical protein
VAVNLISKIQEFIQEASKYDIIPGSSQMSEANKAIHQVDSMIAQKEFKAQQASLCSLKRNKTTRKLLRATIAANYKTEDIENLSDEEYDTYKGFTHMFDKLPKESKSEQQPK